MSIGEGKGRDSCSADSVPDWHRVAAAEMEMSSRGCRSNLSTFCLFAQRVAWGEASKQEVEFMSRMIDVVERLEAWGFGTNDVMS